MKIPRIYIINLIISGAQIDRLHENQDQPIVMKWSNARLHPDEHRRESTRASHS